MRVVLEGGQHDGQTFDQGDLGPVVRMPDLEVGRSLSDALLAARSEPPVIEYMRTPRRDRGGALIYTLLQTPGGTP